MDGSIMEVIGPAASFAVAGAYGLAVFCAMVFSPYGRERRRGDAMAAAAREANRRRACR